jgi:diacylglycerol kinase
MEVEKKIEKTAWERVKDTRRFSHAFRGILVFFASTPHLLVQASFAVVAIILGFSFKISEYEWLGLVFAIGFPLVAEAFNTAIEIDIDLTSPEYHPYAKDTKDVAAGAVLLACSISFIIGAIIFLPKIF